MYTVPVFRGSNEIDFPIEGRVLENVNYIGVWILDNPDLVAFAMAFVFVIYIAGLIPSLTDKTISTPEYYGRGFLALFLAGTVPSILNIFFAFSENWVQVLFFVVFGLSLLIQRPWRW